MTGKKDSLFFLVLQKLGGTQWNYRAPGLKKKTQQEIWFRAVCGIRCTAHCRSWRYKLLGRFRQIRRWRVQEAQVNRLSARTLQLRPPLNPPPLVDALRDAYCVTYVCSATFPLMIYFWPLPPTTRRAPRVLQPLLSRPSRALINLFVWNNYFPGSKLEYIKNTPSTNKARFKSLP